MSHGRARLRGATRRQLAFAAYSVSEWLFLCVSVGLWEESLFWPQHSSGVTYLHSPFVRSVGYSMIDLVFAVVLATVISLRGSNLTALLVTSHWFTRETSHMAFIFSTYQHPGSRLRRFHDWPQRTCKDIG